MADADTIEAPQVDEHDQQPQPTPGDDKLRVLHMAVGKEYNLGTFDEFKQKMQDPAKRQAFYNAVGKQYNLGTYDDFQKKIGFQGATPTPAPAQPSPPEHEISHTPIQDIRHVQEMANRPVSGTALVTEPYYDPKAAMGNPDELARNKAYADQYDKMAADMGISWGAQPETVKRVLNDFPDEQNEDRLKSYASLAQANPVSYGRLKSGNDIRMKMAQDGPEGVHDANVFNHLLNATDYNELTEENLPYQMQLMRTHGMGQADMDKLKAAQSPLINSIDPGLNVKYWQTNDHEYDLTPDEYAGLETERLFSPNKAAMDESILRHARGIGEDGKANPIDVSKESYEYQRGLENVKYNLQQTGRENLARYVAEHKQDSDKQVAALKDEYQAKINASANPQEQQQLIQDFQNHPVVQEANRLEDAEQGLQYSQAEDYRRYPLNFSDQATRAVADAMDHTTGFGQDAIKLGGTVLQGAGTTADNTMRFIKNVAINVLGSDESKGINNAKNIGHQSLTELAAYEPTSYTGTESPLIVPRGTIQSVQNILNGPGTGEEKQQKAISYIRDNFDQLQANPKAGQQNLTGKAALFQAANVMGQILGVANQSFLLGGVIGDAAKVQQMATAFTPMFMSTQNQMYEQALKNGEEHPLLKSSIDATILSLASLINPDIKVVKGMVGADTGLGKMLAGIDESTWNKVLSENKPVMDRMIGAARATGRQLGLATLQYGVIAPTAQYVAHKSILNEDANLGDMIKDGVIQTGISMAMPALLHGVWGGKNATAVNPMQKFALVEAGLHPDQNIDLIDSKIKSGQISEVLGHDMKQVIKHAGEFMLNTEMTKTDGTPMNEKEVADNLYNNLRLRTLQGKLKTAAEPMKPVIEDKIHEVNKEISDIHTSDADKQKADLNQLLHENLDKIDENYPLIAGMMKDDIKNNEPERAFQRIADEYNREKDKENGDTKSINKIYGKKLIDKAIELSKKPKTESAPEPTPQEPTIEKPTEGASTEQTAAPSIHPTTEFRTWDLGDMEGKPENEAAKKHLEGVVREWDKYPAGETGGEPFGQFVNRVIPAFDKILKEQPNNTTIVTHSSVLKAMRVWDEMGRPDVDNLTTEQKKEFADKYNATETHNGDLETFKGDNGDIHVIRHGQTVDNEKNNFRSGDTPLTQKGIDDAAAAGKELKDKTGGDVPQIITSDLPRTIHSSNIINDALRQSGPTNQISHLGEGGENIPPSSEGVGSSQQGQTLPEEKQPTPPGGGQVPPENINELPFGDLPVGIAHQLQVDRATAELNVLPPERGEGITIEQSIQRGKDLISSGVNPDQVAANFKKDNRLNSDDMSVVRARYNELAGKTNRAYDQYGEGSAQAKAAFTAERAWYNDAVKPMQTEWHKIGVAQQSAIDLDTGSITSFHRAWNEANKQPMTQSQEKEAATLVEETKQRTAETEKAYDKVDDLHDKATKSKEPKNIKQDAKKLADKIRQNAKLNRPGMFSAATPASLVWDSAVEVVAKSVEVGGSIADAISKGINHIKESDWYKGLSSGEQKDAIGQFKDWHKDNNKSYKTAQELSVHLAGKNDGKFTPQEAKDVWGYVRKTYLDKGNMSFGDALRAAANDLGLSRNQVLSAISSPKGAKEVTTELWKKNYEQRKAQAYAKRFIETGNQPARKRLWNNLPTYFFAAKTAGHGTVGNVTHAGTNIFRPSTWSAYWPNVLKSFKLAYGKAGDFEKAVDDFVAKPNFDKWAEAKLAIDPRKSYDNFQVFGLKKNWFLDTGNRGFTGLKFMRYDMAELFYNRLSDTEKADPQAREKIAELVNHATGHSDFNLNVKIGEKNYKPLNVLSFAPGLVVSRWQNVYDPI